MKSTIFLLNEIDNSSIYHSVGPLMTGKKVTNEWLVGFVDGDGSFGYHIRKINSISILFEFKVTQKYHSVDVLFAIQDFLGCGSVVIDNRIDKTFKYHVTNREDIIKHVIPLFDKYPLLTSKRLDYLDFKKALELVLQGFHKSPNGVETLEAIKNGMNNKRSIYERIQFSKEVTANSTLTSHWITGFVDAEGHFYFGMTYQRPRSRSETRTLLLQPAFAVTQNTHDYYILAILQEYFGTGYIKVEGRKLNKDYDPSTSHPNQGRFEIKNLDHLKSSIYPFFEKHANQLLTIKAVEYSDWKLLVKHKENKTHLTPEGLELMWNIKNSTHAGRKVPILGDSRSIVIINNLLNNTESNDH